jgi:hypothetical protein
MWGLQTKMIENQRRLIDILKTGTESELFEPPDRESLAEDLRQAKRRLVEF